MSYTVAKVKTFTGRGGRGYSAQLLFDGKVVADAFNEGNGGDVNLDWHDKSKRVPLTVVEKPGSPIAHFWPEEAKLLQFCKGQTRSFLDEIFDLTIYLYVGELVDNFVLEKELRRKCKTKTCFRLKSKPDAPPNGTRAQHAEKALDAFLRSTGESRTVDEDAVRDLIADLGHYCDREGIKFFRKITTRAKRDWLVER